MMAIVADEVIMQERRNLIRQQQMIKKQILRDMSDPFMIGDQIFFQHYRMYPYMALQFITEIAEFLPNHYHGIPPFLQVLSTLRFLAEGSYQKGVSSEINHPMSQPTFSRYLHHVIPAINELSARYISLPASPQERAAISRRFQQACGIPGILGAVDCTLPRIVKPSENEEAYLNYKRFHSLSLQIVADLNYKILSTRICSGSTNDRIVWQHSLCRRYLYHLRADPEIRQNEGFYYIIGDGGYTNSRVLLTPIARAVPGSPMYAYTNALRSVRVIVENTFGILKEKWRCLNSLRGLHYEPHFAAEIVQACTVLHNFLILEGMPIENQMMIPRQPNDLEVFDNNERMAANEIGREERARIIQNFF